MGYCGGMRLNCSKTCHELVQPDPDIAGFGVLISFLVSAYLTMLATAAAANMYGDLVLYHRLATLDESKKRFWLRVLDRLILGFSDQQLVTGISILLIGFISICRISTYHFRVINSLGMFSCSSHLASVLSLRRYFQDHPTVAKIRITAMLFFAGLLSTSLILLGILPWTENIKCNAMCMVSRVSILDRICATLMTLYLIIAYWSALAYVFPNAEVRFVTWFNIRPALWIESALGPMGFGYQFQERLRHYRPLPPLTSSFFLQFIWWILSFVLGVSARARGNKSVKGTESIWTFGQILALLMIGLPFLTAVEVFLEEKRLAESQSLAENVNNPPNQPEGEHQLPSTDTAQASSIENPPDSTVPERRRTTEFQNV